MTEDAKCCEILTAKKRSEEAQLRTFLTTPAFSKAACWTTTNDDAWLAKTPGNELKKMHRFYMTMLSGKEQTDGFTGNNDTDQDENS